MNIIENELVFETKEMAKYFLDCCKVIIGEAGSITEKNIYDIIGCSATDELINDGNNKLELTISDLENTICRFDTRLGGYVIEFKKIESKET